MRAVSPVMYQPFLNLELYIGVFCQYVWNIEGQPGRATRLPSSPVGTGLKSSSTTPSSMPGIGRPIDPGLIGIEA